MKKVLVIGCPGAGKSTFSRKLNKLTNLPVFYLDMIFHKPDKTTYSKEEFDEKLDRIMAQDEWIMDGNYARTLPVRLEQCDTVFWLDYPLEVCLKGIEMRRGRPRVDMPWIETEPDEEFLEYVKNFKNENNPEMERLLELTEGKEIHIFKSREMADTYLSELEESVGGRKMADLNRLGLGTMGMSIRQNPEKSVKTIHAALDAGITLFNTGEFYNAGESEMVVGEAMKGVNRDRYFLSVKFGVLPLPQGGIYGLDVKPHNVKGHLTYSLRRLGLDYVDLYQPARMDTTIPVEEVVGAIAEQVKAGFVKNIGLSMVDAETLRRAHKVHPIHTVEMEYSLVDRGIEKELIATAAELGVKVLAFGTVGHGLLTDRALEAPANPRMARGLFAPENREHNLAMIRKVKEIADSKGMTLSQLALVWSLSKYSHVQSLIGTTNPEHLQESIDALQVNLTQEEVQIIEAAIPEKEIKGKGLRNFVFTDGIMSLKE